MKTNKTARITLVLAGLSSALLLAGCGDNMQDLKDFVAHAKETQSSSIKPPPKVKPYKAFKYQADDRRSPFKLPAGEERTAPKIVHKSNGLHPDFKRKRGPLEEFPLNALRMVGTIQANAMLYALINTPGGRLYRVSPGEHMGQHYGKVVKITPEGIQLREIVPNGFGGYTKQPASIALSVPSK